MDDVRLGRYQIRRRLGAGAIGTVFLALMEGEGRFSRQVAIKRLNKEATRDEDLVEMLIREAWIGGLVNHDNVVPTIDLLKIGDEYFVVSEFVDGIALSDLIHHARLLRLPLEPALVVEVGFQIAQGLSYIHKLCDHEGRPLGLVHRDVKPGNVLLHRSGRVKISDFGAATSAEMAWEKDRKTILGTPMYMAPEQATGLVTTQRSDLYSLGVVLLQALALEMAAMPRFALDSGEHYEIPTPEDLLAALPADAAVFTPLLADLLQPDPAARPASAEVVASDLLALRRSLPLETSMAQAVEAWMERASSASAPLDPSEFPTAVTGELSILQRVESPPTVRRGYAALEHMPVTVDGLGGDSSLSSVDRESTEDIRKDPMQPARTSREARPTTTPAPANPVVGPEFAPTEKVIPREPEPGETGAEFVEFGRGGGYRDWLAVLFIGIPVVALGIWGAVGWLEMSSPEGLAVAEEEAVEEESEEPTDEPGEPTDDPANEPQAEPADHRSEPPPRDALGH